MSKVSGIYKVTNRVNGKAYIGRSTDVYSRWQQHKKAALSGSMLPIHHSIRKHGVENFELSILELAAPSKLATLELCHIINAGTYAKSLGYNIGGTKGGWPSKSELKVMDPALQERWSRLYSIGAEKGAEGLRKKRGCAVFEAAYLKAMSKASITREANIAVKRSVDPSYDLKIKALRSSATLNRVEGYQKKTGAEFSKKFESDSVFRAKISANQRNAQTASVASRTKHLWLDRAVARHMRKAGATLGVIGKEVGRSAAWVCRELQKEEAYAFIP